MRKQKPNPLPLESRPEYLAGFAAARAGRRYESCPYRSGSEQSSQRQDWMSGWYDARYSRAGEPAMGEVSAK